MAPKPELVRLAALPAGRGARALTTLDHDGTLPGRGAYVCRAGGHGALDSECMALATKRGAFQRAFRRPVDVPAKLVESES